ncbi:Colicin I receptor precursor [Lacunisphaera limnophila]|uniref:Colicin I receptor n=1 Tax=Lacunisphaera limnophila TaxID=1838286 RepID=A0A1D8AS31_9BACT|nr:TonB-dependent receptor plug domain-containing protein [Lacunisphaera limnophila]AOS43680.1 Colicin I receptor precursor [Lacunisphaera limnophila]
MQIPNRLLLPAFTGLLWLSAPAQTPGPAPAGAAPLILAPLRVTADLWESPLARIPASVTVQDEASLRAGAVRHFGDLVDRLPNLTWTGGTSRPRHLQIRGIGENSQFEGETPDSAVRFVVDDLDFTGLGGLGSTFDVSQAEVLRGPQAGAFGANAAGGVVRLVTNAPTPYWTGQAEFTAGEDALRSGGFAVGGPLGEGQPDRLMMRLAVQQSESDGFRRNVTLGRDTNARDELTARLRLTWNPNAAWRWEAAVLAADLDSGYDEFALDNNGTNTFSDQPGRDAQESFAASLRGTYAGWDGVRLSTVTSGARTRSVYSYDDDWTAASYMGFSDLTRTRWVVNQELRLDSVPGPAAGWISRWTLGAFLSDTEEFSRYTNTDPWDIRGLRTIYRASNLALFGQVGHDFTPRTRLVAGLRAERIDLEGEGTKTRYRGASGSFDPVVVIRPTFEDTLVGGKVALEHDLSGHELLFVSLTRGYKAGGVNVDARIDPATDPLTYATETLWNAEAGLRGHWLDERLTGEVTAFALWRRDTQVRDSAGFGGSYRFFTDNGDGARVTGLEASAAYALTRAWSVRGSLALMRSRLDPFTLGNGNAGGGRVLANTPRYGYTWGVRYDAGRGLFGGAELAGRAEQFDSNNQNEARRAFRVVNATLGYAWERWTVTLWAKNLLDEVYDRRVYFFGNEDPDYLETRYENRADPRQLGVTAAWRF